MDAFGPQHLQSTRGDAAQVRVGEDAAQERLVEVAANYGCTRSRLVQRAADMDWQWLDGACRLGITAGASAP